MAQQRSPRYLRKSILQDTMKTNLLFTLALAFVPVIAQAQERFFTRTGTISFFSETPVENIEATNHQASSIVDIASGEIAVSAQMKGFAFEKALMQEHFNENYVESEKFPTATFKGRIKEYDPSAFQVGREHKVQIVGDLTLHGETKNVNSVATIFRGENNIKAITSFNLQPGDFNIKIPSAVANNIAKSILVNVDFNLEPYQK